MSTIQIIKEYIREALIEGNKPPKWLKKAKFVYLDGKTKVKVIEADGPKDYSIVLIKNKKKRIKTKRLKKKRIK